MGRRKKVVRNVEITGMADKGKGVGRDPEGRVLFVENVAPGDVVDVLVRRKKKGYMMGFPIEVHKLSEDRVEPFCQHYDSCGGCQWQHLSYEKQAHHKEVVVRDAIERIAKVEVGEFFPIRAAVKTTYYRNKLEFAFSNKRWLKPEELNDPSISNVEDVLGFHRAGAYNKIVNIEHCWLEPDPSNAIRNAAREIAIEQGLPFFDMAAEDGFLRHLLIRVTSLGEILVIVSFYKEDKELIQAYLDALLERFPEITTLCYCINPKKNDFLLDLEMVTYHGKGFIEDQLHHVRFKIGPKSFFQTNTSQAEILYQTVADFAGLDGTQNVYDLYTGVGSIALYLAKDCKHIVGIEEVEAAIEDAYGNAALNGIENCTFYAGDVKDILSPEFAVKHGRPDVVITDPPRAGMHPKVVELFLELESPQIVYVSCNPATQARDLNVLKEKYEVAKLQPVDMFPHTHHIETVALLKLRQ
jgi:23S rRNA (uracil1939-C5)-methyltransferase